jgi:hypothetical protein
LERARSLTNEACFTVALQHRRLLSEEPEDRVFIMRRWADFHFLIVALQRLRRAAMAARNIPDIRGVEVANALAEFDSKLPQIKVMRDMAEHIDDYSLDRGRMKSISRKQLQVGMMNGRKVYWLDEEVDLDLALRAAEGLTLAVRKATCKL